MRPGGRPIAVRRPLLAILGLLAGAVLAVGSAGPAGACSCVETSDDEAFAAAAVVFAGVVTGRQDPPPAQVQSSADPATWSFAVSTVYKGDVLEGQQVQSAMSGASCGLELRVGGEYLVFADRQGPLTGNLCNGTRELANAAVPESFGPGEAPTSEEEAGPPGAVGVVGEEVGGDDESSWFPRSTIAVLAVLSAAVVGGVTLARSRRPA